MGSSGSKSGPSPRVDVIQSDHDDAEANDESTERPPPHPERPRARHHDNGSGAGGSKGSSSATRRGKRKGKKKHKKASAIAKGGGGGGGGREAAKRLGQKGGSASRGISGSPYTAAAAATAVKAKTAAVVSTTAPSLPGKWTYKAIIPFLEKDGWKTADGAGSLKWKGFRTWFLVSPAPAEDGKPAGRKRLDYLVSEEEVINYVRSNKEVLARYEAYCRGSVLMAPARAGTQGTSVAGGSGNGSSARPGVASRGGGSRSRPSAHDSLEEAAAISAVWAGAECGRRAAKIGSAPKARESTEKAAARGGRSPEGSQPDRAATLPAAAAETSSGKNARVAAPEAAREAAIAKTRTTAAAARRRVVHRENPVVRAAIEAAERAVGFPAKKRRAPSSSCWDPAYGYVFEERDAGGGGSGMHYNTGSSANTPGAPASNLKGWLRPAAVTAAPSALPPLPPPLRQQHPEAVPVQATTPGFNTLKRPREEAEAVVDWSQTWQKTWPTLREEGWHWEYRSSTSCVYYLKPGATREGATLGLDMFDSKDAVIEHVLDSAAPPTAPTMESVDNGGGGGGGADPLAAAGVRSGGGGSRPKLSSLGGRARLSRGIAGIPLVKCSHSKPLTPTSSGFFFKNGIKPHRLYCANGAAEHPAPDPAAAAAAALEYDAQLSGPRCKSAEVGGDKVDGDGDDDGEEEGEEEDDGIEIDVAEGASSLSTSLSFTGSCGTVQGCGGRSTRPGTGTAVEPPMQKKRHLEDEGEIVGHRYWCNSLQANRFPKPVLVGEALEKPDGGLLRGLGGDKPSAESAPADRVNDTELAVAAVVDMSRGSEGGEGEESAARRRVDSHGEGRPWGVDMLTVHCCKQVVAMSEGGGSYRGKGIGGSDGCRGSGDGGKACDWKGDGEAVDEDGSENGGGSGGMGGRGEGSESGGGGGGGGTADETAGEAVGACEGSGARNTATDDDRLGGQEGCDVINGDASVVNGDAPVVGGGVDRDLKRMSSRQSSPPCPKGRDGFGNGDPKRKREEPSPSSLGGGGVGKATRRKEGPSPSTFGGGGGGGGDGGGGGGAAKRRREGPSPSKSTLISSAPVNSLPSEGVGPTGALAGVAFTLAGFRGRVLREIEADVVKLGGEVMDIFGKGSMNGKWRERLLNGARENLIGWSFGGENGGMLDSSNGSSTYNGSSPSTSSPSAPKMIMSVAAPGSERTPEFQLAVAARVPIVHPSYVDACARVAMRVDPTGYLMPLGRSALGSRDVILPSSSGVPWCSSRRERPFIGKVVLLCCPRQRPQPRRKLLAAAAAAVTIEGGGYADGNGGDSDDGGDGGGGGDLAFIFGVAGATVQVLEEGGEEEKKKEEEVVLHCDGAGVDAVTAAVDAPGAPPATRAAGWEVQRCNLKVALELLDAGRVHCVVGPSAFGGSLTPAPQAVAAVVRAAVKAGTLTGTIEWALQCMAHGRLLLPSAETCPWFPLGAALDTSDLAAAARGSGGGDSGDSGGTGGVASTQMKTETGPAGTGRGGSGVGDVRFYVHVSADGRRCVAGDYVILENTEQKGDEEDVKGRALNGTSRGRSGARAGAGRGAAEREKQGVGVDAAADGVVLLRPTPVVGRIISFRREICGGGVKAAVDMMQRGGNPKVLVKAAGDGEGQAREERMVDSAMLGGPVLVLTEREMEATQRFSLNDSSILCLRK